MRLTLFGLVAIAVQCGIATAEEVEHDTRAIVQDKVLKATESLEVAQLIFVQARFVPTLADRYASVVDKSVNLDAVSDILQELTTEWKKSEAEYDALKLRSVSWNLNVRLPGAVAEGKPMRDVNAVDLTFRKGFKADEYNGRFKLITSKQLRDPDFVRKLDWSETPKEPGICTVSGSVSITKCPTTSKDTPDDAAKEILSAHPPILTICIVAFGESDQKFVPSVRRFELTSDRWKVLAK
jgi:hypothetical protein